MSNEAGKGGVGFLSLLGLLFIGLKLADVIDWSWCWVLFPLYGPLLIFLFVVAIVVTGIRIFK